MIDRNLDIRVLTGNRGFFGIEMKPKLGAGSLTQGFCRSFANSRLGDSAYLFCSDEGVVSFYHREYIGYNTPQLIVDQATCKIIRDLRRNDWICIYNNHTHAIKLLPKHHFFSYKLNRDDFAYNIVRRDGLILGLSIAVASGSSAAANFFISSFGRFFYNEEAHIYAHKGRLYLRHYCFRFCDSLVIPFSEEDFVQLADLKDSDWMCNNTINNVGCDLIIKNIESKRL